jgi:hypothetical protein
VQLASLINEGAPGETLLTVTLDCRESAIAEFEWIEDGKPYREWLIPARFINKHGSVRIADDEGEAI